MGPSRRDLTIREVEKFLEDSAEELPPMRECAKEPVCVKERARVRNGVVTRCVDGSRRRTSNQKLATSMPRAKTSADVQADGERGAASATGSQTSGEHKAECAVSAEKSSADGQTIEEQASASITDPRTSGQNTPPTDPPKNNTPTIEAVNEPLCIKQHYIRGAGYTGLRDKNLYPNAIPFQQPLQDLHSGSAQADPRTTRLFGIGDRRPVTNYARPFQQPNQHPGPSGSQDSTNQAQGVAIRHPGNPRNIHQYVSYDNCTENVRDVDHTEP